ncbi:TPA: hypothetical protein H1016_01755 [archaeon]|uniref:Uncharacterized protein n=1 Tax=Candidatus Naiadarchaeum limnaeum TaxID=2756139 RepID=A0A832UZM9_9ARCH|nr:hypothetical protein [Candidatus Naiadarchaeum limnaeum]
MAKQKKGLKTSSKSKKYLGIDRKRLLIGSVIVIVSILSMIILAQKQQNKEIKTTENETLDFAALANEVIPQNGFETNAKWGCTGKKLVESGAINLEKFKLLYERGGRPLTETQLSILTKCTDETLKIDNGNAHFMLNVLWALGLSNKNALLDKIAKEADFDIGNLASTGGWPLGNISGGELWGKYEIIKLNAGQQKIVEKVALNTYRPCCNNPTAFPDCNHGAAALGLIELMASQGATEDDIFEALKIYNAYWFPQQYYENAIYFKLAEGKEWKDVDPKVVLGFNYSSASGWTQVSNYLRAQGIFKQVEGSGGQCGV